jgi:hypothetical protein
LANEVQLQEGHPVDENIRPIKVGGKTTAIETAQSGDGAKITGNLDVIGQISGNGMSISASEIIDNAITLAADNDITLTAGGEIILDADADVVEFKNSGTSVGKILSVTSGGEGAQYLKLQATGTTHHDLILESQGTGADIILDSKTGIVQLQVDSDADDLCTLTVAANGVTTIATTDSDGAVGHLTLAPDGKIILNSASGGFEMHGGGATAKFADMYAGMILGYTDIGLNEAHVSLNLTTSYVVPTDEFSVVFIAPPSGNVEIFMQIWFSAGSTGSGDLFVGLSTANATSGYAALQSYHEEQLVDQSGRYGVEIISNLWTLTGLTAGTSYEYWMGFKSSSTGGTPYIRWGGNATGRNPDFIMKATALPASITT